MNPTMRRNKAVIPIAILLALCALIAWMQTQSLRNSPDDFGQFCQKAFVQSLTQVQYQPRYVHESWRSLSVSNFPLVFANRPVDFASSDPTAGSDASKIREWVAQGHTLVLLRSSEDDLTPALHQLTRDEEFVPSAYALETSHVLSVRSRTVFKFVPPDSVPLLQRNSQAVAYVERVGKGSIIAISDGFLASDDRLPLSDDALFLSNIVALHCTPQGEIAFFTPSRDDEARPYKSGPGWSRALKFGILQCALVSMILLIALTGRFGTPRLSGQIVTRTSAEYLTSMGVLYRTAKAAKPALEIIYKQTIRDCRRSLAVGADVANQDLPQLLGKHYNAPSQGIQSLFMECESALAGPALRDEQLIALVHRLDSIRKELGFD